MTSPSRIFTVIYLLFGLQLFVANGQDSNDVSILSFDIQATETQLISDSYTYTWELDNAIGVTLESIPYNPYNFGYNNSSLVTYIFGETDAPTPPGGAQPLGSGITLSNIDFFRAEGSYFVHLTAYGQASKDTKTILVNIYADPNQPIEIINFSPGYGSNDGILRIDTEMNIYWLVRNTIHTELQVKDNTGQLHNTYRLPANHGVLNIPASDLVSGPGYYEIQLHAYTDEASVLSYSVSLDIEPPLGLPPYIQKNWVETTIPVTVCIVTDENGHATHWRLNNENPHILSQDPLVQVLFDWRVTNVVGETFDSASAQTQTGKVTLEAIMDYGIVVDTYLDIDNSTHRYPIGRTGAIIYGEFGCPDAE